MNIYGRLVVNPDKFDEFEAVSMQVKTLNPTVLSLTLTSQGQIRLMAASSQGA